MTVEDNEVLFSLTSYLLALTEIWNVIIYWKITLILIHYTAVITMRIYLIVSQFVSYFPHLLTSHMSPKYDDICMMIGKCEWVNEVFCKCALANLLLCSSLPFMQIVNFIHMNLHHSCINLDARQKVGSDIDFIFKTFNAWHVCIQRKYVDCPHQFMCQWFPNCGSQPLGGPQRY